MISNWKTKWFGTRFHRVWAGLLTASLGLFFLILPAGEGLLNLSYDLPFAFRAASHPDDVAIIYMDDDSHSALGQKPFSEWDRTLHTKLLGRLTAWGAKAVVFDILFETPGEPVADQPLMDAMKAHGKVVLAAKYTPVVVQGEITTWKLSRPFEAVQQVASWGLVEVSDDEKTIREHVRDPGLRVPSLAWKTVELTSGDSLGNMLESRWMNYYGPPGSLPHYSYAEVLTNDAFSSALSNKVIFVGSHIGVGFSGGKGTDDFRTPYTRWTNAKSPGVEINATAYLNLLKTDWLKRLPVAVEFPLVLLFGLAAGCALTWLNPLRATLACLGAMLLVFVGACLLALYARYWFPWLMVCGVELPFALVFTLIATVQQISRERESLPLPAQPSTPPVAAGPAPSSLGSILASGTPTSVILHRMKELQEGSDHPATPASADAQAPPPIPDHTLVRRIGSGAYGEVWLAKNVMGSWRGVKIVYRANFQQDRPYEREFEGLRHFEPISRQHPGLVHILHIGRNQPAAYFFCVMEIADDLRQGELIEELKYEPKTLAKQVALGGALPLPECLQIALHLTAGLSFLHEQGLIHRDIKPSNIIFVGGKPKFADIGLVTEIGVDKTFVGTPGYFAPEGPGSPPADIYSLGKVLYEICTGLNRERFPDLPTLADPSVDQVLFQRLNRIILKACENHPANRFRSATEMREELLNLRIAAED